MNRNTYRYSGLAALVAVCLWLSLAGAATRAADLRNEAPDSVEPTMWASAAWIEPARPMAAERILSRAAMAPAFQVAQDRLWPLRLDVEQPRIVATRFGWIGVHYPLRGPTGEDAGLYALWLDETLGATVAQAEFLHQGSVGLARLELVDHPSFVVTVDLSRFDADRFWDCLRSCTRGMLDHWLYTLVRAVCSRACVPVTPLCAPCVIALSALEAGMISGCVYECGQTRPEAGSWALRPGAAALHGSRVGGRESATRR